MGTHIKSSLEDTYKAGASTDTSLGDFLKRPIELTHLSPTLGQNVNVVLNPWDLFVNDFRVRNRIQGFRHLRGHLKIRAVITGNPLAYGKFILAYHPRADRDITGFANQLSECYRMQLSMLPHIFLDPSTGEGGEMTLPFFCPENWLDLTNTTSTTDMGELRLVSFNPLRHANSADGDCTITLYAWMENPELCTPTSADYGSWVGQSALSETSGLTSALSSVATLLLALCGYKAHQAYKTRRDSQHSASDIIPQSGFGENPISRPASAISRAAGWLAEIPWLTPYAKATEVAFKGVAGVASAFGYSRPQIITPMSRYRELWAGQNATTNTKEIVARLAADEKGELTIDPRTVGLPPIDEMSIPYVAGRECYIHTSTWSVTDTTASTLCWVHVNPTSFETDSTVTPLRSCITPSTIPALMFKYWRGTMIYRFQVVCSSLHRGKLRITYDPVSNSGGEYNEVYSRVIDIQSTRDFEIPISWHARTPYLETFPPDIGTTNFTKGDGPGASFDPNRINGIIRVEVLHPLGTPDPTLNSDVSINVFSRAGDDIQFAVPYDGFNDYVYSMRSSNVSVVPQSGEMMDNSASASDNAPVGGAPIEPVGDVSIEKVDNTDLVFFGETIPSFRTLMKRYIRTGRAVSASTTAPTKIGVRRPVNTNLMDPYQFLMYCYAGWRGSFRFKLIPVSTSAVNYYPTMVNTLSNDSADAHRLGGSFVNNSVLEVEHPYFFNRRFSHARTAPVWTSTTDSNPSDPNTQQVGFVTAVPNSVYDIYYATGEDFSLFFFLGPPLLYQNV